MLEKKKSKKNALLHDIVLQAQLYPANILQMPCQTVRCEEGVTGLWLVLYLVAIFCVKHPLLQYT